MSKPVERAGESSDQAPTDGQNAIGGTAKPPLRDGVVAVLQDETGRYLFIRRGWTLARAPGVWCFPGGEVEAGEPLKDAIEREMMEELGLRVVAGEKIHESISPNGVYLLHWFRVERVDAGAALHLHPVEVAEVAWHGVEAAWVLEPILPTLRTWLLENR